MIVAPLGATATASLQMLGVAPVPVARSVAAAPHARASTKLPPTLLLRSAELAAMCERSDGKGPGGSSASSSIVASSMRSLQHGGVGAV